MENAIEEIVSLENTDTSEKNVQKKTTKKRTSPKKVRSERYQKKHNLVDPTRLYTINEAIKLVKDISYAKFDSTVEVHFNLSINPKKTEQSVRTSVTLPHGSGKKIRVLAFALPNQQQDLEKAGIMIADNDTFEKISGGWLEFDVVVAHPSFMPQLAKVSKILGPRGMMPNPKSGTVGENVSEIVNGLMAGKMEIKSQPDSTILHSIIGKVSFTEAYLKDNFISVYKALITAKPPKVKEPFVKSCAISPTMGPSIKVNLTNL